MPSDGAVRGEWLGGLLSSRSTGRQGRCTGAYRGSRPVEGWAARCGGCGSSCPVTMLRDRSIVMRCTGGIVRGELGRVHQGGDRGGVFVANAGTCANGGVGSGSGSSLVNDMACGWSWRFTLRPSRSCLTGRPVSRAAVFGGSAEPLTPSPARTLRTARRSTTRRSHRQRTQGGYPRFRALSEAFPASSTAMSRRSAARSTAPLVLPDHRPSLSTLHSSEGENSPLLILRFTVKGS